MRNTLEAAVIPSLALTVGGGTYTVEFPLSAVIQAEEKLGRSLKNPSDWFNLASKDVTAVLEAGLSKHQPDIAAKLAVDIGGALNPEALDEVQYALVKLAFPRYVAKLEELQAKAREAGGTASPNAPSGAAL